jgi:hypothetical protein
VKISRRAVIGGALGLPVVALTRGAASAAPIAEVAPKTWRDFPRMEFHAEDDIEGSAAGFVRWSSPRGVYWPYQLYFDLLSWEAYAKRHGIFDRSVIFLSQALTDNEGWRVMDAFSGERPVIAPLGNGAIRFSPSVGGSEAVVHRERFWGPRDKFLWSLYNTHPIVWDASIADPSAYFNDYLPDLGH